MRILVFLLVLANLLFYAYAQGYFGTSVNEDAFRLDQQVAPEKIRVIARGEDKAAVEVPAAPEASVLAGPDSRPEDGPAEAGSGAAVEPSGSTPGAAGKVCLQWPAIGLVEAERIGRVVTQQFSDFTLRRQTTAGENPEWWVHIPPLADRAAAEKKTGELRALGVTEYFIVQEGRNRHAVSLGVFSSEARGKERLAELRARGVRSARLGMRPDKDGMVRLQLRGPAATSEALLAALALAVPGKRPDDCP